VNIFFLDTDPRTAAQFHCDTHVSKMLVETAQILSTARRIYAQAHSLHGPEHVDRLAVGYKSAYSKHPSVLWASLHVSHLAWLYELAAGLQEEHRLRSTRAVEHASAEKIREMRLLDECAGLLPDADANELFEKFERAPALAFGVFAHAFRRELRDCAAGTLSVQDAVTAYRRMYVMKAARWEAEAQSAYGQTSFLLGKMRTQAQSAAIARRKMTWYGRQDNEPSFFAPYRSAVAARSNQA